MQVRDELSQSGSTHAQYPQLAAGGGVSFHKQRESNIFSQRTGWYPALGGRKHVQETHTDTLLFTHVTGSTLSLLKIELKLLKNRR